MKLKLGLFCVHNDYIQRKTISIFTAQTNKNEVLGDVSELKKLCEVDGGMEKLRAKENEEVFHAFAQIVLPSVTGKMLFRNDAGQILLSAFTMVQDEALGMLCLENNFLKWECVIKNVTNDDDAKELKTKYASLVNAKDDKQHVRWWLKRR